jgi:HAD superfamily hydrolase (TIGR01509 family)
MSRFLSDFIEDFAKAPSDMIQNILFDLSDTLVVGLTGVELALEPCLHLPGKEILQQFRSDIMLDFLLGICTEDEYLARLKLAYGWEPSIEQVKAMLREHFRTAMPGAGDLITDLSKRYPLYLVSDNGREWVEYIEVVHPFLKLFTRRFYSFELHTRKNNPDTYREVLRQIGADAETCLFVDDRRNFLETGARIGLTPILFEGSAKLRTALRECGITL